MRDDFYSQLAAGSPVPMRRLEQHLLNVPPVLGRDELQAIIAGPAARAGVAIEPGLVDDIIADAVASASPDAASSPGADDAPSTILPLLEFALTELWKARKDGKLTRASYREEMGRLTGVLTSRCDRAFGELPEDQQNLAQRLLADLVEDPSTAHPELPPTRRRRRWSQLPESLRNDPTLSEVAGLLADRRLLITGREPQAGEPTYELIHDSLLRHWG